MRTVFFLEHEVASDRWEPLGLVEAESASVLLAACAELAEPLLPGRFRCLSHCGAGTWRYFELAADGAELNSLL